MHDLPEINPAYDDAHLRQIFKYYSLNPDEMEKEIHRYAATLFDQGQVQQAWRVLLILAKALLLKVLEAIWGSTLRVCWLLYAKDYLFILLALPPPFPYSVARGRTSPRGQKETLQG